VAWLPSLQRRRGRLGLEEELVGGNNEILPCHPRRKKGGEAHADGREKALEENTRHHCFGSGRFGRPLATMDHATSVEGRDSWRYDILRRLPFPTPLLSGLGNCMIGRVMRDR
jgi:hypothetical protein